MENKQAKLQEQYVEMYANTTIDQIFKGLVVYVNGYTDPSSNELRRMLVVNKIILFVYFEMKIFKKQYFLAIGKMIFFFFFSI